jgi:dTDP-4-dehydrorhamnose reductase
MRILITGAAGGVGRELVDVFADHEVMAFDRRTLDIADRDAVLGVITSTRPDVVVNSAAFTAVDACETETDRAWAVNAMAVRHLADGARRVGATVCHLSTDYVFDGTQPDPYVEWDQPNPASMYGRSKLGGELELGPDDVIVRTSWVCGYHGANMVKTILRLAAEHETLTFVDDQRGHPTFADDLAVVVHRLVVDRRPGLFHVTNQGAVSWFEFARAVLEAAGHDPARVSPVATADLKPARPAPRPANSVLDNAALRLSGVALAPDFHEPLARLVARLAEG